jgi:dTDP-6-deoxy-L-talose 4-dehydrogenase (NAD+)
MRETQVIECDVRNPTDPAIAAIAQCEGLIHLAWGHLHDFNAIEHLWEGHHHLNFLAAVIKAGVKRILVTGTCMEYGLQDGLLREDEITNPVTPYGLAKDTLRRQLQFLQARQPFWLCWARLFYMYGDAPGRRTLWMMLSEAVARGEQQFPMSPGEQLRDYLPVVEVAARLARLAAVADTPGIVNISSGKPVSIRTLVETWIAENNWPIAPKRGAFGYLAHEPLAFWGDDKRYLDLVSAP